MIAGLALLALVSGAFGVGAYQALEHVSAFVIGNAAIAATSALLSLVLAVRRIEIVRQPALRGPALRSLGRPLAVGAAAVLLYQLAAGSNIRFDWTFEGTFELASATKEVLGRLPGPLEMTLYYNDGDPRIRTTKLLLEQIARGRNIEVRTRVLEDQPEEEDKFGIGSSNSVVLQHDGRWTLVQRPTEGGLFEGISQLANARDSVLYVSVGAGEGDLERTDDLGYSGLRAALETEGIEARPLPLALLEEVPADATAVLMIAPQRPLRATALLAIERYIDAGGSLVAFVEPGSESGLESLLAHYGLATPDALVIDPASGPIEGDAPGVNPIAFNYAQHPVSAGLGRNRMTFFRRARSFELHKAQPHDRIRPVVHASRNAWLYPSASFVDAKVVPERPADARTDYYVLVAAAEIERQGAVARILAFGDSTLASNRYLRALYNLDLVMNGIHWVVARETRIALRPKSGGRQLIQFPVPVQNSLQALYGVGLLIPEMLLLTGGVVWIRQRRG